MSEHVYLVSKALKRANDTIDHHETRIKQANRGVNTANAVAGLGGTVILLAHPRAINNGEYPRLRNGMMASGYLATRNYSDSGVSMKRSPGMALKLAAATIKRNPYASAAVGGGTLLGGGLLANAGYRVKRRHAEGQIKRIRNSR